MLTSIVDPGPLAPSGVRNSTLQQQLTEQPVNRAYAVGPSAGSWEEDRIRRAIFKMGSVLSQAVH
jgi:hypothetical protein